MTPLEEIALRILCAQIAGGKANGTAAIENAFALAVKFQERSKEVAAALSHPAPKGARYPRHSFDDNGL